MPKPVRHLVVIGAGIAGLSLAYAARDRFAVSVLEAGAVGQRGASSLPAALLNPYRGRTARADDRDRMGLDAFWRRSEQLEAAGLDAGASRSGVLRIASTERQATMWREAVAGDDDLAWWPGDEVPAPYRAPHGALLVRPGGWVRPKPLLMALADAVRARGSAVHEQTRARDVRIGQNGRISVVTAGGELDATHVALCTGAEPTPGGWRPAHELRAVEGDVSEFRYDESLPLPLAGAVYAAGAGDRVWVGGHHRRRDDRDAADNDATDGGSREASPGAAEALRRSFAWFAPSFAGAASSATWTGTRLKREGNRPLVVELAPGLWFFGAFAGRGFLCAAAEAEGLVERLGP